MASYGVPNKGFWQSFRRAEAIYVSLRWDEVISDGDINTLLFPLQSIRLVPTSQSCSSRPTTTDTAIKLHFLFQSISRKSADHQYPHYLHPRKHPSSPAPSASPSLRLICRWCTLPLTLFLYFFTHAPSISSERVRCHKPPHPYLVFFLEPSPPPQPHSSSLLLHAVLKNTITRIYGIATLSKKAHGVEKQMKWHS